MVSVQCQPNLLEVIETGIPPCRLTGCLDCRQQKPDEHSNDRNHDQEFNEGETMSMSAAMPRWRVDLLLWEIMGHGSSSLGEVLGKEIFGQKRPFLLNRHLRADI